MRCATRIADDTRFDLPGTPIEKLPEEPRHELVRVEGVVHAVDSGASITLRDDTGEVRVMTRQTGTAGPGGAIEAIGYPEIVGVESRLLRGIVRVPPESGKPIKARGGVAPPILMLRLVDQIRRLDPVEASRGFPVEVRGMVTWSDPASGLFFLLDGSGGIEVHLPPDGSIPAPEFGMDVFVQGVTQPGNFVSAMRATKLVPAEERTLPSPKPLTLEQAMTGAEYAGWTEFRGYVHSVTPESGGLARISLTTTEGELVVRVRGLAADNNLVGALISVRGVCDAIVNDRHQLTGVQLLVSSPDLIKVEERAPADLFALPLLPIGSLLKFGASRDKINRVRVSGVVALHRPGVFLYLVDGDDRLLVLSRQTEALEPGDRVEVVGIPGNEAGRLVMRDAFYRRIGKGPVPPAHTLAHPESPKLEWDGMTVRLQGRLLDRSVYPGFTRLRLQQGSSIFDAQMPGTGEDSLVVGSLLELTGIYRVQLDEYRQPRSFSIDLRTPGDVRVMTRPSWWTSTRVLWVSGALLVAMLLTAGWGMSLAHKNRLLRVADRELQEANSGLERRVVERTRDLQSEISQRRASEDELARERRLLRTLIDNLPVYLYVKNTERRFVIGNLPHARLLGAGSDAGVIDKSDYDLYPAELAERYERDDRRVLATGEPLLQYEEPSYTHGQPGWFSTTKVPVRDTQGRIAGLIGISLDITGRKKADEERSELQRRLMEASRQAGMSEIATGVLHNVGNVLNSVNVSATLVTDQLRNTQAVNVAKVAALLGEHQADLAGFLTQDARGRMIPGYLATLAESLAGEHEAMLAELEHLRENIGHIKDIVAMQQSHAGSSGVIEPVMLAELVEEALRINASSLARHDVALIRDFQVRPLVTTDRHQVMQILINLLHNAKDACDESGRPDKRITVRITGDDRSVKIAVLDNGSGIAPENLTRIFNHGFTTKQDGHGFGLHSAALAAKELGGSLHVQSDGLGHGATFTLELPCKPDFPAHENPDR